MKLTAHKLSEEQVKEISNWKYTGEYSIYNLPSWDKMIQENYSLTDNVKRERYIGYINEDGELVGFVNLLDEGDTVFFGIGIKPNYCSKGIGKVITKMALIESQNRFPNKPVILEVRTWNKRAVNCYKSQGFEIVETKQQLIIDKKRYFENLKL
ncbi:GNAT family N-acetyltransferase [uncultured Clostridium sp.]|uniref:GNAT family N-acetyltransferase n=1 Tax=uncultured Clostridium sp. TaxID=59620 RepID=UPI002600981D|nr:GNAT family N-acetyltransferase [uncultured Clostridium sp.]MDU4884929.1 GNAT family N-acetyltransferase [Clostridium celatum]MDU7078128.1 GNAT family N-acetyltransferase [Clostridium celatum]